MTQMTQIESEFVTQMTQMTQIESEHDTDSEKSVTYYVYYTKLTIEKAFANKRASSSVRVRDSDDTDVRASVSKQASVSRQTR